MIQREHFSSATSSWQSLHPQSLYGLFSYIGANSGIDAGHWSSPISSLYMYTCIIININTWLTHTSLQSENATCRCRPARRARSARCPRAASGGIQGHTSLPREERENAAEPRTDGGGVVSAVAVSGQRGLLRCVALCNRWLSQRSSDGGGKS